MNSSKLIAKQPTETSQGKTKGILFGASGVGKTWFSLEFPKPYYIDTEGGAKLGHYQNKLKLKNGVYLGQNDGALDFNVVLDQIQTLATVKHDYQTLIIDSITKIYQISIANESERLLISGKKDEFGLSKKPAISHMRRIVNWIQKLDMNVWFIAHESAEWGEVSGQRTEIGKTADIWDKLMYELDIGIRVLRRGNTYPPIGIVQKSRLLGFQLGETFNLEYNVFAEKYGKNYIEKESVPLSLANEKKVIEIKRLVDLLKISSEDCEKVLTKAGADKWEELTETQADDMITRLTSKIKGEK